uniref:Uncharacterized protein n=1 Tax=Arundo donax TaxID=35708 RepID=A0A0A9E931_ARUDO
MEALECMIKRNCTKKLKYFTGGACRLPNLGAGHVCGLSAMIFHLS